MGCDTPVAKLERWRSRKLTSERRAEVDRPHRRVRAPARGQPDGARPRRRARHRNDRRHHAHGPRRTRPQGSAWPGPARFAGERRRPAQSMSTPGAWVRSAVQANSIPALAPHDARAPSGRRRSQSARSDAQLSNHDVPIVGAAPQRTGPLCSVERRPAHDRVRQEHRVRRVPSAAAEREARAWRWSKADGYPPSGAETPSP